MFKNIGFRRILFLLLVSICFCILGYGQDMLIRLNGDTIRCKVTKIDTVKVYIITKTKNGPVEYPVYRSNIKELIVPVLPDDPTRMVYEKNIERFKSIGSLSAVGAVVGIALSIKGLNDLLGGFQNEINGDDSDTFNIGFVEAGIGLPLAITGTIIGFISLHKIIYNKSQLNKLYNLSINMEYDTFHKGISISYKF